MSVFSTASLLIC